MQIPRINKLDETHQQHTLEEKHVSVVTDEGECTLVKDNKNQRFPPTRGHHNVFSCDQKIGMAKYSKRQTPPEQGVRRNQSNMWIELRRPRNLVI